MSPRWQKIGRDVVDNQGRLCMMVIAITAGIFAVTAIATAYAVLHREIDAAYLKTSPPAVLLDVDHVDAAALLGLRRLAGISWAEGGDRVWARIKVESGESIPILLFGMTDFRFQHMNRVDLRQGKWPVGTEQMAIEQSALPLAGAHLGRELTIEKPDGSIYRMSVAGIVHDASLAPAPQQQAVYGYVPQMTMERMDANVGRHRIRLTADHADDARGVEKIAVAAADWLRRAGYEVGEISIPPRHHPHWRVMNNIIRMLLAFSVLNLILGGLLSATLTAGLLAPQVRQIGILKAIGARSHQIMMLYLTLIAGVGMIAVIVGLPSGIHAGRALAEFVLENQNLEVGSLAVPRSLYPAIAVGGMGIPLLLSAIPIGMATRRPVRESLVDCGVSNVGFAPRPCISAAFARFPLISLAVRNATRRRARTGLSLALMAVAGAMFVSSMNIRAGWEQSLIAARREHRQDIEIQLRQPQPAITLVKSIMNLAGVGRVEAFDDDKAAPGRADSLTVTSTFPDGEHGSLSIQAVPADSAFVTPNLVAGAWLSAADLAGSVLNTQALVFFPNARIGDVLHFTTRGHSVEVHLTGVVVEHLAGAAIYVTSQTYARELGKPGFTKGLRVGLNRDSEAAETRTRVAIESLLHESSIDVAGSISHAQMERGLAGHLFILIFVLFIMSTSMALVGVLGLGSAVATGVLERRRELAVMRAIGASRTTVQLVIVCEALCIATLSVFGAAVLSVPLTVLIARLVGTAMLGPWQNVIVSTTAVPVWLGLVLVCSLIASAQPARRASKMTIHQSLVHQ